MWRLIQGPKTHLHSLYSEAYLTSLIFNFRFLRTLAETFSMSPPLKNAAVTLKHVIHCNCIEACAFNNFLPTAPSACHTDIPNVWLHHQVSFLFAENETFVVSF